MSIENLACSFNARYGQISGIQQSNLNQHRSLVPVDMLVSKLVVSESDDCDQWNLHPSAGRRNSRQHPIHRDGVGELEYHFVDDLVVSNSSRDWCHLRVRWHLWHDTFRIEFAQLMVTRTTG